MSVAASRRVILPALSGKVQGDYEKEQVTEIYWIFFFFLVRELMLFGWIFKVV